MKPFSLMTLFIIFCLAGCGSSKHTSYARTDTYESKKDPRCRSGDCMNGEGNYLQPSGNSYEGNFRNGYRHGFGTYTLSSGKQFQGIWNQNDLNGPCKVRQNDAPWEDGICTDANSLISFQKKAEPKPVTTEPKKPTDAELKKKADSILERIKKRKY